MTDLATYHHHRSHTADALAACSGPRLTSNPISAATSLVAQVSHIIRTQRRPGETKALDYGCGNGTMTDTFAQALDGQALGVDPSLPLIREADTTPNAHFLHAPAGSVPAPSRSFDLVIVSLVLGGLNGARLGHAVAEIMRVLKRDGLLILIEATGERTSNTHWTQRSAAQYQALFPNVGLNQASTFDASADHLTLLAGREGAGAGLRN